MLRSPRTAVLNLLALLLTACGGESPTSPDDDGGQILRLAGSAYDLIKIDGVDLPHRDGARSGCVAPDGSSHARTEVRIAGMQLGFEDAGQFRLAVSTQERCLADDGVTPLTSWSTRTVSRSGFYDLRGRSGTLSLAAATFPFTVGDRDELTVFFLPDVDYLFQKR